MGIRRVSELYGHHAGEDVYVVGTGPSLRVFPREFLAGKTTIGLNDAWRFVPVHYGITVHPDLYIPEFLGEGLSFPSIRWVTKHEKTRNLVSAEKFRHAEEHFYFFESEGRGNTQPPNEPRDAGRVLDWVRRPTGDFLYLWSSISQTAANLAANMGAKNVILIGCDGGPILANDHIHAKPTRWKGVDSSHRYRQYYEGLAEVRAALRQRGVNLVSLIPFMGVSHIEEDFRLLCGECGVPEYVPTPYDRSP